MQRSTPTTRALPMWRSLLFCPANAERFVARAHMRGADAVILDLEDSVPAAEKAATRATVQQSAQRIRQSRTDVLVRINRALDLAVADIAAAVGPDVTALVVPKVKGPEHLQLLAELVGAHEAKRGLPLGHTRFVALVENAAALTRINDIAAADPRLVGLAVGGEDLATDLNAEPCADSLYVAKMLGVHAARAADILPIGVLASVAHVESDDAYRSMLSRSRTLGFSAATCVHPAQVPLLNAAFGPNATELNRARRLLAAYDTAMQRGQGAFLFEDTLVDEPVALRARRLLERTPDHSSH